jgi:hypothetical protein
MVPFAACSSVARSSSVVAVFSSSQVKSTTETVVGTRLE